MDRWTWVRVSKSFCSGVVWCALKLFFVVFFFNDTATTEIYTLSLHDALPISLPFSTSPILSLSFPFCPLLSPSLPFSPFLSPSLPFFPLLSPFIPFFPSFALSPSLPSSLLFSPLPFSPLPSPSVPPALPHFLSSALCISLLVVMFLPSSVIRSDV